MQPTTEFNQLLKRIDSSREVATRMKATLLLQEVNALEKRIKDVGSVGMRLKTVQKDYSQEVDRLQKKLYTYAIEGIEDGHRRMRFTALSIAIFFFSLYLSASFIKGIAPQQPTQIVAWLVIGILGGLFIGLNFYLLYLAIERRHQRFIEKYDREPSKFSHWFASFYLKITTINSMGFTLQLLLTWVYPFSSSFLEGLVNRIMQGDLLAIGYAFITGVGPVIVFVQAVYSLHNFLKKAFRRK